eukprot:g4031.t1
MSKRWYGCVEQIRLKAPDDEEEGTCAKFVRYDEDADGRGDAVVPKEGNIVPKEGDILVRINGESTIGRTFDYIQRMIREEPERIQSMEFRSVSLAEIALPILSQCSPKIRVQVLRTLRYVTLESFGGGTEYSQKSIQAVRARHAKEKKKADEANSSYFSVLNPWRQGVTKKIGDDMEFWKQKHRERVDAWIDRMTSFFECDETRKVKNVIRGSDATKKASGEDDDDDKKESRAQLDEVVAAIVVACCVDGSYDGLARVSLRKLSRKLGVDRRIQTCAELQFTHALRLQRISAMRGSDDEMDDERRKREGTPWGRYALVGGGAVVGGLVIGLTGGLATPLIAAGMGTLGVGLGGVLGTTVAAHTLALSTFLATTGGVVVTTALFGTTGASLTAYKMNKRTKGISDLSFKLCSRGDRVALTICVSGWVVAEDDFVRSWGAVGLPGDNQADEEQILLLNALKQGKISSKEYARICEVLRRARVHRAYVVMREERRVGRADRDRDGAASNTTGGGGSSEEGEGGAKEDRARDGDNDGDVVGCCESGGGRDPLPSASTKAAEGTKKQDKPKDEEEGADEDSLWWQNVASDGGDLYAMVWERKELIELGNVLKKMLGQELAIQAGGQLLKYTALGALAAAVAWPAALLKISEVIDNPWSVAVARADAAGIVLADVLSNRNYGRRPLRLIGFSLGARVIFRALLELYRRGSKASLGLVEEVILLGLPEMNSKSKWRAARTVVSGRLVNGHIENDWVLSYLFRATDWRVRGIAGIHGVRSCEGVENIDLTHILRGHLEYRTKMKDVLSYIIRMPNGEGEVTSRS